MVKVAALYVDPRGPYPKMDGVDCWDETRDARKYDGPWPIVAHPPCGPWGALKHLYKGNEHDCALRAVDQVRGHGGVLEHPARSLLWPCCDLPPPGTFADRFGGFTLEVDQCAWGHVARKRSWLYFVGVSRRQAIETTKTGGTPTHWVSGFHNKSVHKRYGNNGQCVPAGIKICSAQQRRRTPPSFAEWLVSLAMTSTISSNQAIGACP